jgi:geranylgeranyl pyrophosphate synthase
MSAESAAALLVEVRDAGGVERARRHALQLVDDAIADLSAVPASPFRDALRDVAQFSVERVS